MTAALLWDLWRRGRWHLVTLPAGLALFAALLLSIVPLEDPDRRDELGLGLLLISLICLAVDFLHLAEGERGAGCDARAFVLPVSSRRLAATRLAALSALMVASYLAGSLALRAWIGTPGPNPAAALGIGGLTAWIVCGMWLTPRQPGRRTVVLACFGLAFALPLRLRFPDLLSDPLAALAAAGPAEVAVLALVLAGAFPAAVRAVARQRRGDADPESRAPSAGLPGAASRRERKAAFSGPAAALLWLARREQGSLLVMLFAVPWVLLVAASAADLAPGHDLVAFGGALIGFTVLLGPVLVAGIVCRVRDGNLVSEIDPLRTLRPLSCSRLAGAYLRHGALALTAVWTLTATGALAAGAVLGETPEAAVVGDLLARFAEVSGPDLAPRLVGAGLGAAVAGWLQVGLLSALLLTGRTVSLAFLIVLPYGAAAALLVFRNEVSRVPGETLLLAGPWIAGAAGILATVAAVAAALGRRLVSPWAIARQAGALLAVLALSAAFLEWRWSPPTFAALGLSVAVLAPWPAASLAVYWNRHR